MGFLQKDTTFVIFLQIVASMIVALVHTMLKLGCDLDWHDFPHYRLLKQLPNTHKFSNLNDK